MYTLREAARAAKRDAFEHEPEAAPAAPAPEPSREAPRLVEREPSRGWRPSRNYAARTRGTTAPREADDVQAWGEDEDARRTNARYARETPHEAPAERAASVRPTASYVRTPEPAAAYARSETAGAPARTRFARIPKIDPDDVIDWALNGKRWIVLGAAAGLLGGAAFGLLAQPRYTVYTDILVPPSNLQVVNNDLYAASMQSDAQVLEVESRMRVMTSGNVLRRVATSLDLLNDPEFNAPPKWWDIRAKLFPQPEGGDQIVGVMRDLSERIKVGRQDRSYLVTAAVWTWDPEKSVKVANALTEAFRQELVRGDASGAAQAAQTLNDRLAELKAAVSAAEDKVQAFRRDNNLQQSAANTLVSTQSMQQYNAKLIDAQARETEAASRYRQLTEASRAGALEPSSSLQSPTLTQLRVQYAELRRQVESMSLTYGPRHPALTTIRTQLKAIEREVFNETARMVTAAKVDLDQSRQTLAQLTKDTEKARTSVSVDDEAQVKLRELERDALAKGSIYQAFLTRAGEATQREQVDATSVRVISAPVPPEARSYPPRTMLLAAGGLVAGLGLGLGLALALGFLGAYRRMLREG